MCFQIPPPPPPPTPWLLACDTVFFLVCPQCRFYFPLVLFSSSREPPREPPPPPPPFTSCPPKMRSLSFLGKCSVSMETEWNGIEHRLRTPNQNYDNIGSLPELCIYFAFICITFHLHYVCISFTFRIAPRIDIFALHFINISKCQINVK